MLCSEKSAPQDTTEGEKRSHRRILLLDLPHRGGRQDQRRNKRQRPRALQPERAQLLRKQPALPENVPLGCDTLSFRQASRIDLQTLLTPTLRQLGAPVYFFCESRWVRAGVEDDGPLHDEEHLVAALAVLEDGLAAREGGRAQARGYETQALVVEPLPQVPTTVASREKWGVCWGQC